MNYNYFSYLYSQINLNLKLYLIILFFIALIYILILKKHIYSIADPIVFMILACVFSASDVFFMYFCGMINLPYFINFCITECLMLLGIIIFPPIKLENKKDFHNDEINKNCIKSYDNEEYKHNLIYMFTSVLFNLTVIVIYYKFGIVLFDKTNSRLDLAKQMGIFYLIINMTLPVYSYLLIWRLNFKTRLFNRILDILNLVILITYLLFSGSKSAFVIIMFSVFYYIMYLNKNVNLNSRKIRKLNKYLKFLLIVSTIVAIIIMSITKLENNNIVDSFIFRLVGYGDIYPNYYLTNLNLDGGTFANGCIIMFRPIVVLFKKLVGIFNIEFLNEFPSLIGLRLYQTIFNTDTISGPNSRHNIYGLFYFGYVGSMLFSFILGLFIGFSKNKLYKILPNNIFGSIIYMLVSTAAITNVSDPSLGINNLIETLFYYLFIYITSSVIVNSVSTNKLNKGKVYYGERKTLFYNYSKL